MVNRVIKTGDKGDVWFVYDGDCPICQIAANGLAIKEAVGNLYLINAREDLDHPILQEVKEQGLNLDEGLVIKFKETCYHGAGALQVMSLLGTNQGWFNRMNYLLFRSRFLSNFLYPSLRGIRNIALKLKGVSQIKNLENVDDKYIIFQPVFGEEWDKLPPVMRKRYSNRAYTDDVVVMEGVMDIKTSRLVSLMSPILKVIGALVPHDGQDIPVTVRGVSSLETAGYTIDREFRFKGRKSYYFMSTMEHIKGNEVIEFMRFGIGWRSAFSLKEDKVILEHLGYVWRIFGFIIPLPMSWLLGKGFAEETPLTESEFKMMMNIYHPVWGKVYEYRGVFKVVD